MLDPLVGNKELPVNTEANYLHIIGLRAELDGDFIRAHSLFSDALGILHDQPDTIGRDVQTARVKRDDGFTHLREAIAGPNELAFEKARLVVQDAVESMDRVTFSDRAALSLLISKKAVHEVLAERGATISLLGRIASAKQVVLAEPTRTTNHPLYSVGQEAFDDAAVYLRDGNNGYYRVSNAMTAARHERLNSNYYGSGKWFARAIWGVAWTAVRNPRNLLATTRTFGSRTRHLLSRKAAESSINTYP